MDDQKEKLWVFDTQNYLEVYAPTLVEAYKEVHEIERETGLDFIQACDWERYQEEHGAAKNG